MIVVSDTTPLNYLILIQFIDLLPKLFGEVYVPRAVLAELLNPGTPGVVRRWAESPTGWLVVKDPVTIAPSTIHLDSGEAEAISLALELHASDILIDEKRATKVVKQEGFVPLPTLAILELAAEENLIDLRIAIQRLRQTSIRIPIKVYDEVLRRDDFRRQAGSDPK